MIFFFYKITVLAVEISKSPIFDGKINLFFISFIASCQPELI